jgi:2-polyprenyl-3-methyl-5-hydroxy-6-metoxy-1,4-benzoquinol methylase
MTDPIAAAERTKYERMWSQPEYRRNSPGLNAAPAAFHALAMRAGRSLTDYGCGEGRALDWFRGRGIHAKGVDIVALRPDVTEACLWDLPAGLGEADYAYCADVMEHLPEQHVPTVLRAIGDRTREAGYFTVATVPCKLGRRHGETLHLTVRPRVWWEARFREAWREVRCSTGDRDWRLVFEVRP